MDCALDKVLSGVLPDVTAQRIHESLLQHSVDRLLYGTENDFLNYFWINKNVTGIHRCWQTSFFLFTLV